MIQSYISYLVVLLIAGIFNIIPRKISLFLGKIISPIIMGVIFFLVVTPIGLLMRFFGKDVLNLKLNKKKSSYWIEKDGPKSKMRNQF